MGTENGITVIGAGSLPSTMPAAASAMYARNISALLQYLMQDGALALDLSDEIHAGVVVTWTARSSTPRSRTPSPLRPIPQECTARDRPRC